MHGHLVHCGLAEEGSESRRKIVNSLGAWWWLWAIIFREGTLELDTESGRGNRKGTPPGGEGSGGLEAGMHLASLDWFKFPPGRARVFASFVSPLSALLPIFSIWLSLSFSSHFCLLSAPEIACGLVSLASRCFHSLMQRAGQLKNSSDARRFPPRLSFLSVPISSRGKTRRPLLPLLCSGRVALSATGLSSCQFVHICFLCWAVIPYRPGLYCIFHHIHTFYVAHKQIQTKWIAEWIPGWILLCEAETEEWTRRVVHLTTWKWWVTL